MQRNEISTWRPKSSRDILGEANRRRVKREMADLQAGKWAGPLAIVGPYGTAKTSCCRLLAQSACCPNIQRDGEPCGTCRGCISQNPDYNGDRHKYRHWEIDCAKITRKRLTTFCTQIVADEDALVFLDEMPNLPDAGTQKVLLKFTEDFRGVLLLAVTVNSPSELLDKHLIPPLCERLRQLRLKRPPEQELVQFLVNMARTRNIQAAQEDIRLLVRATQGSFRKCLQALAHAEQEGLLSRTMIGDVLNLDQGWEDDLADEHKD